MKHELHMKRAKKAINYLLIFVFIAIVHQAKAQNDLPNPIANPTLVKQGSLVIGMDNTTQALPGYFNLKSYGLANRLLQAGIPIKWAIKAGKAKDGIDFTSTAQREYPSVLAAATYNFKSGPFIVDSANAQAARSIISTYGNNVAVYRLTQNVVVDVRYNINFKPRVAIFDNGGNSKIHLAYVKEAGFDTGTYVTVIPELTPLNSCQNNGGFSFASEAHWDDHSDTTVSRSVYRFVKAGGNFLAGCVAIELYENDDTLHTTTGLDVTNINYSIFKYPNADLPMGQIDGPLADIGGALHNWYKKSTGNFRAQHYCIAGAPTGIEYQTVAGAKCIPANLSGGNMFYLGGHNYGNGTNPDQINGRRMYLNCIFVPPGRSAYCNLQPLAVNFASTAVKCKGDNNGTATANFTGGVQPYRYSWTIGDTSRTLSNLPPGSYTINVTDNIGQTTSATVTITEPASLSLSKTVSNYNGYNVSCLGSTNGFINLSVNGGVPSYSYSWSNGASTPIITNIGAGSYAYVVTDANGCKLNGSVNITSPSQLLSTKNVSDFNGSGVSCKNYTNGFINITPSGGVSSYTYLWSPGNTTTQNRSNLGAGTYICQITDANGCTATNGGTITSPNLLTAPFTTSNYNGKNVSCAGSTDGAINLNVSGGTGPFTYMWFPGGYTTRNISNVAAGNYSYVVTDLNGCTTSSSVSLDSPSPLVAPKTVSNYNGSSVSCNGSTNGSINLTVSGGTSPFTYIWSTGNSTTRTLSNLGAGTYTYNVTDVNGCEVSGSATLTQPATVASIKTVSNYHGTGISCLGSNDGSISLAVSGGTTPYVYSWNPGSNSTSSISGLSAGTFRYTVTDANGCSLIDSATISSPPQLNALYAVSVYNGSNVSCNGSSNGYIQVNAAGGISPYTYSWNTGDTGSRLDSIGAGTFIFTVTDLNGCNVSKSVVLNTSNSLLVPNTVSDYNGFGVSCFGSTNGYIDLSVAGGTAPYSFSWSPGNMSTQNLTNISAGSYSYTVTDANGCTNSGTIILDAPVPMSVPEAISDYNGTAISCAGASDGSISLNIIGGTAPYAVSWLPGNMTTTNISGLSAGIYSYNVVDANGCTVSDKDTLKEPQPLMMPHIASDYNGTGVSCFGSGNGFVHVIVSGGTFPYQYSWSANNNTTSNLDNISAGVYTVDVTDVNGCVISDSFNITQPIPIMSSIQKTNFNGYGVSCAGGNNGIADLTVFGGTGPYHYVWSTPTDSTQDIQNLTAGFYTVIITDNNGCAKVDSVRLTEPPPLNISGTVTNAKCNGSSDGAVYIKVHGGVPAYSYHWSNGFNSDANTNLSAGQFTLTVNDANGCENDNVFTVTEPSPISLSVTSPTLNGTNQVSCYGNSDGTAQANTSGGTTPYAYSWSNGSTATGISGLSAGTYSVVVTDIRSCTSTSDITLTQPQRLISTAGSFASICGNTSNLSAMPVAAGISGTWIIQSGNAVIADIHDPSTSLTNMSYGRNLFQWIVTDGICAATDTVSIQSFEPVTADAGTDDKICLKMLNGYLLRAVNPVVGTGYWSSTGMARITDIYNPIAHIESLADGSNEFIWTVVNGVCSANDDVEIFFKSKVDCYENLEMPTAFSPNGDGANDDFDIHGIEKYPDNTFEVFNRWGNLVYKVDNYVNHQWTGTNKSGEPLPDGTYFAILKINNNDLQLHGYVDIRK